MHSSVSRRIRILVVDDDREIADVLRDAVAEDDRPADVCYDGLQAIEYMQKNVYDLIIVDLVIPRVGGLDILRYAKKSNPDVIVIIITGYASLETAIAAIREGAYDYIQKPFKLEEIRIVVQNAVDKLLLRRENAMLLENLQQAYARVSDLEQEKREEQSPPPELKLYSSDISRLQHLLDTPSPSAHYIDRMQALSSLKDKGVLTEKEFDRFKDNLMQMLDLKA